MKGLHVLIKLARHTTTEHCAALGRAGADVDTATRALDTHEAAMGRELHLAASDPAVMAVSRQWAQHAARHRVALRARHQASVHREAEAREVLRMAFIDQKRFELAQQTRQHEQRRVMARHDDRRMQEAFAATRPNRYPVTA
jgi:hypothetical protein